ncbi:MAG: hypothetical protein J07HX64_02524 [halophilic archaeon J07HX64]|jgi:hypothetical protein|nr:MAG: hypothetical protein J07HX64_02524 [halophilic archaeon J07HX64]
MKTGAGAGDEIPDTPDAANVLLLAPVDREQSDTLCLDALSRSPPAETRVLAVTYGYSPAEFIEAWADHVGEAPAAGGVVAVGESESEFADGTWRARFVKNPGDLTGIGIQLSELLSDLAAGAGPNEEVVVCFDAVSSLLQYADLQRSFRFLHVVTGRVRNADSTCYYHLDPDAHDEQTMATLDSLFDSTVESNSDGWTVSR